MQELLLIDKPAGITSFDVIRQLRKKYSQKGEKAPKMGHAGTLDPFATGLMLIGVGKGTKKLSDLIGLPKTYEAVIELGRTTETLDPDGEVCRECDASHLDEVRIKEAVASIVGVHTHTVPAYSAVKQKGERLYKKAYRGEEVDRPERKMQVHTAKITEISRKGDKIFVSVVFDVASGTYIRSLAESIGKVLSVPSMLSVLRRTVVGDYSVKNAKTIENIEFFEEK